MGRPLRTLSGTPMPQVQAAARVPEKPKAAGSGEKANGPPGDVLPTHRTGELGPSHKRTTHGPTMGEHGGI